jgi:hypothetical protein
MVVWAKAMPRSAIIWTRSRELTKLECQIPPDNDFSVKMPTLEEIRAEMGSVICGHYPRPPFSSVCTRTFKSFYQPDLRQYYELAKAVRFRFQTTGRVTPMRNGSSGRAPGSQRGAQVGTAFQRTAAPRRLNSYGRREDRLWSLSLRRKALDDGPDVEIRRPPHGSRWR